LSVVQGMTHILTEHRPLVWLSMHPDLMDEWYGTTPDQVHELMAACGYSAEFLGHDHEDHWLYRP
jgi:hypothetical protein